MPSNGATVKVMELCLSPDFGGLEIYVSRCVRELSRSLRVIPVVLPGSRLEQRIREEGGEAVTLRRHMHALPLLTARRLARLIDKERVDVIHLHWTKDIPLAAFAKLLAKRRVKLVSTRQMQITRPKRDVYHRFLYRQIDLHLAITETLAEAMRGFLPPECATRVETLYHGVAEPAEWIDGEKRKAIRAGYGAGDDTLLVGLFGRIKHYKGQHLLVEAVGRAVNEGKDMAALIIGHTMEKDYLKKLKQQVQQARWEKAIHFEDFVAVPQQLMQACDVIVLTTYEETFGLVLVEAMRAGVAVIGSDKGGVPEIIDDGETGLLFKSGEPSDLHAKLDILFSDISLRRRLAHAGRAEADRRFVDNDHYQGLIRHIKQLSGDR